MEFIVEETSIGIKIQKGQSVYYDESVQAHILFAILEKLDDINVAIIDIPAQLKEKG